MGRTSYEAEEPSGKGAIISNVCGVLAQELRCKANQIIETTSCLQSCSSRNH